MESESEARSDKELKVRRARYDSITLYHTAIALAFDG